eukprot:754133-Hanusia_phi.AAC.1
MAKKVDAVGKLALERSSSSGSIRHDNTCSRKKPIGVNDLYFYCEICHTHGREVGQAWLSQATGLNVGDDGAGNEPALEELHYITSEGFSDTNVFEYLLSLLNYLCTFFLAMLAWRPNRRPIISSNESKKKKKKGLKSAMRSIKEEELPAGMTADNSEAKKTD